MLKLGLVGQHITKSLTQTFFQELSEIYNIELSYDLFDLFNQNISIEEKLKELSDKVIRVLT
jgi:shikimate 5-dehydrogenase